MAELRFFAYGNIANRPADNQRSAHGFANPLFTTQLFLFLPGLPGRHEWRPYGTEQVGTPFLATEAA